MKSNRFVPQKLSNEIRNDPKKKAEVKVFDGLYEQLSLHQREWVVVYSARWLSKPKRNQPPRTGEADFLLAHPTRGIVVVEVKGGLISFENGQWYTTNRFGQKNEIDPFSQVERNAYELAHKFEQLKRWSGGSTSDKYARWVIFPDSVSPRGAVFPTDYSSEMVTDASAMDRLSDELNQTLDFWYGSSWNHPAAKHACPLLVDLFDNARTFTMPLGTDLASESKQIDRLTDSQYNVISAIAGCNRVAVAGGAGSGKTWLARKRACELADEGFRVLLTCKSKPLAKHLDETTPAHDQMLISAYSELLVKLGGPEHDGSDDYGWTLAEYISENPALSFDAIFVDEGQDFSDSEWDFVESLLGTEKQGVLYVFYDDNQQLVDQQTSLPENMVPLQLADNVRTTRSIHKDMVRFYQGIRDQRPQGPTGRSVEHVASNGDLKKCVRQTIADLLRQQRVHPQDIVVLTPLPTEASSMNQLGLVDGRKLVASPRSGQDVQLSSVDQFKGLERPIVILAETDKFPEDAHAKRRLVYTALSRPKHHLILIDFDPSEETK